MCGSGVWVKKERGCVCVCVCVVWDRNVGNIKRSCVHLVPIKNFQCADALGKNSVSSA